MQRRTDISIAANSTNPNVLQGLSVEYVRDDSTVTLAATGAVAGLRATLRFSDEVVLDDANLPALATGPVLPDHILVGRAFAGRADRLLLSVTNTTAGAIVLTYLIDVNPV